MNAEQEQRNGPSLSSALERLRDAGQRIISDEIGLVKLEAQERVSRNLRAGIFVAGGAALGLIAWVFFMIAVYLVLRGTLSAAGAAAVVGVINALIGGATAVFGLTQGSPQPAPEQSALAHQQEAYAAET